MQMSEYAGTAKIAKGTVIKGEFSDCELLEVHGVVEGSLKGGRLVVHPGGEFRGSVNAETAEIHGMLQGQVRIKNLIKIHPGGEVSGRVQYGSLAMENGGNLDADVRNIPPELAGDLNMAVSKGGSVRVELDDLNAIDPDDVAVHLTYTVTNPRNGWIVHANVPDRPVKNFTQADLEDGKVMFVHDGTTTGHASFDVVVADKEGATSGAPQTVTVAVRA